MLGFCPVVAMAVAVAVAVVVLVVPPVIAGDPFDYTTCGSGAYAANSTYQANLDLLATVFPANASATPAGFSTATVGEVPGQVSALALCRGDTNASSCLSCVAAAFRGAQRACPLTKDVTIYLDGCLLRFSDQRFLNFVGVNSPSGVFDWDTENLTVPAARFDAAVTALMNATVNHATTEASNSTKKNFATAEEDFDAKHYPKIYGLAQCAPDMTVAQCRSCLGSLFGAIPWFLSGRPGGRALGVWCNLRYNVNPFYEGRAMLQLPAPPLPPAPAPTTTPSSANGAGGRKRKASQISAGVACSIVLILIIAGSAFICLKRRKALKSQHSLNKIARGKCTIFDFPILQEATENFSDKNKLGEGGFGVVYKGKLSDGQEIAVKKLLESTGKGLDQLHNEVLVLAKLQHNRLVRLLGFCLQQHEMLLVYEHITNGSLDNVLFDASRGKTLNWEQRYIIIHGIAKGILYLHEDSATRVVHRDLKANNVLLDEEMNPKIADFGLARLLGGGHTQTKTAAVVGTYGYMAPEYAIHGRVSPKIDVFSFGVLVLEIVTGRRNTSYDNPDTVVNLLTDVWNCWTKGTVLQLIDPSLDEYSSSQVPRCIHIGLLCVQADPDDRPDISSVVFMLTRDGMELQQPVQPAFFFGGNSSLVLQQHSRISYTYDRSDVILEESCSVNEVTFTDPYPR